MTVIEERRRDVNLIAGLLIVAFAFAAVRGASQAPILAGVMGVLAVVSLGIWLRWRLSAPRRLTISEKEITFGRPGRVTIRVPRTDGPLVLRSTRSSRWLASSGGPGIPMLGYDLDDVRRACVSHAWEFTTG